MIELEQDGMVATMVGTHMPRGPCVAQRLTVAGTCFACKKGMYQMCDNQVVNGETKPGGCKFTESSISVSINSERLTVSRWRICHSSLRSHRPCPFTR